MGFLRLYLAICVVQNHFGIIFPWSTQTGSQSVQIFFLISGFYMSLISYGKYNSPLRFYESRFIRIFAPFYITLVFFAVVSLFTGFVWNNWGIFQSITKNHIDAVGKICFILSCIPNISIFGADLLFFLSASHDNLTFTSNFHASPSPLYLSLLIPQSWSVSLELIFYLLTPFLCSLKNSKLIFLVISSLLLRIAFYETTGITNDPWSYRVIFFEFFFFGLGILLHRSSSFFTIAWLSKSRALFILPCVYIFILILGNISFKIYYDVFKYLGNNYSDILSVLLFAPFIGLLFVITKDIRFDRFVGDLSYPIYLNHLIIGVYLKEILPQQPLLHLGLFTASASIIIAIIFQVCFFSRIDLWRVSKFIAK